MTIAPGFVGIDVSKHRLDIFDSTVGRAESVANTAAALAEHLQRWRDASVSILFEATGRYDGVLRTALAAAGLAFTRVNPGRARDFARAMGFLAKTDAVDARMLAAMAERLRPPPTPPATPPRAALTRLQVRRDQLVAMRQQERTRAAEESGPAGASIARILAVLDAEIAGLERDIAALIAGSEELAAPAALLRSVPGIGPVTAAVLLAALPELGRRSPKSIAALVGLAPLNNDSGTFRGHRAIRGGRKRVRDALYMAAVAASRSKSRFAEVYKALRAAGKPPKVAFVALARKILTTLNAIVRDGIPFRP